MAASAEAQYNLASPSPRGNRPCPRPSHIRPAPTRASATSPASCDLPTLLFLVDRCRSMPHSATILPITTPRTPYVPHCARRRPACLRKARWCAQVHSELRGQSQPHRGTCGGIAECKGSKAVCKPCMTRGSSACAVRRFFFEQRSSRSETRTWRVTGVEVPSAPSVRSSNGGRRAPGLSQHIPGVLVPCAMQRGIHLGHMRALIRCIGPKEPFAGGPFIPR